MISLRREIPKACWYIKNGNIIMMVLVWVDRQRQNFITTCSILSPGAQYSIIRWYQVDKQGNYSAESI